MNTSNEKTHDQATPTKDTQEQAVTIPRLSHWELAALERISENYWDERVLACEDWDDARDEMAIDGLLGSLVKKLQAAAAPLSEDDGEDWPLEDEEQLRIEWVESGGNP